MAELSTHNRLVTGSSPVESTKSGEIPKLAEGVGLENR